jgi:hypothetical protein
LKLLARKNRFFEKCLLLKRFFKGMFFPASVNKQSRINSIQTTTMPLKSGFDKEGETTIKDLFQDVACLFYKTDQMKYFIPSTENYFGPFQSKTCIHESGYSSHLIAISSESELQQIFGFCDPSFGYDFNVSHGVAGDHVVLEVKSSCGRPYQLRLAKDIFDFAITLDTLRFFLCSDDCDYILNHHQELHLSEYSLSSLKNCMNKVEKNGTAQNQSNLGETKDSKRVHCRTHSLLDLG